MERQKGINEMQAYELTFLDGEKRVVHERTYSRAIVRAGWERMSEGAEGHKQLHVVSGERRKDLDVPNVSNDGRLMTEINDNNALLDFLESLSDDVPRRQYKRPHDVCVVVGPNGMPITMHTEVAEALGLLPSMTVYVR